MECWAILPHTVVFTGTPGMQVPPPQTPLQFFQLFFTRELLQYLVTKTNGYATFIGTPSKEWEMCNEQEMAKFLGLFFLIGITPLPTYRHYWKGGSVHDYPVFGNNMTCKHFRSILSHFHTFNSRAVPAGSTDCPITIHTIMTTSSINFSIFIYLRSTLPVMKEAWDRRGSSHSESTTH